MTFREILDLFRQGKASAKSHMKNLIEMATVDGTYSKEEDNLLISIANRNGISERTLESIRKNGHAISFVVPEDETEKFTQLYDLVHMMIADNQIHPEEARLSELFATRFGYPKKVNAEIVDTIKGNIENGNGVKETFERVQYLISFSQT